MALDAVVQVSIGRVYSKGGIPVSPTSTHGCNDGGYGITDFIGVSFKEEA